jgi:hypothetical protein
MITEIIFQSAFLGTLQTKLLFPSFLPMNCYNIWKEIKFRQYYQKIASSIAPYPKIDKTREEKEGRKLLKSNNLVQPFIFKLCRTVQKKIPQELKYMLSSMRFDAIKGKESRVL